MNYKETWANCAESVCKLSLYNENNEQFASGTGFKARGFLITNSHVITVSNCKYVEIQFNDINRDGAVILLKYKYSDFISMIVKESPEEKWDYVVINIDCSVFSQIPSLILCSDYHYLIGSEISIIGFPFSAKELSMHKGIISSKYKKNNVN